MSASGIGPVRRSNSRESAAANILNQRHGLAAFRQSNLDRPQCSDGCPQQIQRLGKRKQFTQQKIDKEIKTAKELSRQKNKRGAMMALKKKKLYEKARRGPLQAERSGSGG